MERKRALLGIIIALVGLFLLLDNLHLIPYQLYFLRTWQMLLILIGLFNFATGRKRTALILFVIGGFFLIEDYAPYDFRDLWPLILIAIGVIFIIQRKKQGSGASGGRSSENAFDTINIFGGGDQKFDSPALEGGRITSIFAGSSVDLRDSNPLPNATIDVFVLFGGCEIVAPDDWKIKIDTFSLFGGFADERRNPSADDSSPQVIIKGFTMFGGGEIKSR